MRRGWAALEPHYRVIAVCLAIEVVLIALNLLDRVADLDSPLLDIEREANAATWWSSIQFMLAGLAAGGVALLDAGPAVVWWPIAAVMTFFSADEIAQFHEHFEEMATGQWVVDGVEPLVALAVLAFALYALRKLGTRERILLVLAAVALAAANVSGALNNTITPASSLSEHVLALQEEWSETIVGVLVLAAALPLVGSGLRKRYAAPPVGGAAP